MAWILANIILFVLWAVILVSCSKKNHEPKLEEKRAKTSSTSPSITTSVDSVEKACSKNTTISKTGSMQNEAEKDKKDSNSSIESKEIKDCAKVKNEAKKSKDSTQVPQVMPHPITQVPVTKESDGKQTPVKTKESKKDLKESQTIKKMSLEKLIDREEDVKCDKEVSQKPEESERILHFSKKKSQKATEKHEDNTELLEPTPLSWKEET